MYKNFDPINRVYHNTLWHLQQHSPSFAWIKNPQPQKDIIPDNQEFLALAVNDTYLEKAIAVHTQSSIFLEKKETFDVTKLNSYLELFELILSLTKENTTAITINASFKLNPTIRNLKLDGQICFQDKNTLTYGLSKNLIGEELEKFIYEKTKKKTDVIISHDTNCLFLAGMQEVINPEAVISGIIDDGTNFALIDKNYTFNLESGHFSDFDVPQTTIDIAEELKSKDSYLFEKTVSGQFLYQHYNLEATKLNIPLINSTIELSFLSQREDNSPECILAKRVITMSAQLIGAQIAGIHTLYGKSLLHIIIKGYLFETIYQYKEIVEATIQTLGIPIHKIDWITIKEDSLLGSSWLVRKF